MFMENDIRRWIRLMEADAKLPNPDWFMRGERVNVDNFADFLEGDELDWEWRLCRVPLNEIETDPAADLLDQDRLDFQKTARQIEPVVLGIRADRLQVYDGWHLITVARERQLSVIMGYVGKPAK